MPAPKKNRFAAKPRDEQHSESLYVRLRKHDKQIIVEAAGDASVAAWARGVLLEAAENSGGKPAINRRQPFHSK
jgi:hypothetical protein